METHLTIKHLAPYLPYGLKGSWTETFEIEKLIGFCEDEVITNVEQFPLKDFKPILRPLSDLIEEIEHNGEKFIPLIKLFDISVGHNWSSTNYLGCILGVNEFWLQLKDKKPSFAFGYNWENEMFYYLTKENYYLKVYNQLGLFNKLFEWHFDVFGLIEKGIAIDINTLK